VLITKLYFQCTMSFGPRDDSVHTGSVVFNQTFRFPKNLFLSTSFGIFSSDRYGFDLEARKYFLDGDLSLGINYGLTSFISFSGFNRIYYFDKFTWTGNVGIDYRIQKYDLTLSAMVGKFLLGDTSFRFDINREFGEIEIGFLVLGLQPVLLTAVSIFLYRFGRALIGIQVWLELDRQRIILLVT